MSKPQKPTKNHQNSPKNQKTRAKILGGAEKMLHITGGQFNGCLIKAPDNEATHPMGSRERLALFNVLNSLRGPMRGTETILDAYYGNSGDSVTGENQVS